VKKGYKILIGVVALNVVNAVLVWLVLGYATYRIGRLNSEVQVIVSDLGW